MLSGRLRVAGLTHRGQILSHKRRDTKQKKARHRGCAGPNKKGVSEAGFDGFPVRLVTLHLLHVIALADAAGEELIVQLA
ncbi:hypothetical protein IV02_13170 [Pseudomonas syringae]|uniref:Uncharacterized protein n=1 Tax=Pseudomonas syringae TaxID=317 RepID=A0A085V6U8_PSESX|nr:hypothetical protein IV02_13170 [Pseudomonas syringae]